MPNLINIETGEVLDIDTCTEEQLESAWMAALKAKNKADRIHSELSQAILDRVPKGEKKFLNISVISSNRTSYHYPNDYEKKRITKMVNELKQPFARIVKTQYLKAPKY